MSTLFQKKPIYYLGSPYSHSDPKVREFRIKAVTRMTYKLFKEGRLIYSPLTHNIPLDNLGILGDYLTWLDFDHGMLSRCDGLLVFKLPGWEISKGLNAEISFARELGLPVEEIIPSSEFLEHIGFDQKMEIENLNVFKNSKSRAVQKEIQGEKQDEDILPSSFPAYQKLSLLIRKMIEERDWDRFNSPKNLAMSLQVEAAEVADHFVWLSEEQSADLPTAIKQQVSAELGDVFINLISLADHLGVDLFAVTEEKLEEIKKRYPIEKYKGKQTNLVKCE